MSCVSLEGVTLPVIEVTGCPVSIDGLSEISISSTGRIMLFADDKSITNQSSVMAICWLCNATLILSLSG